MSRRLHGTLLAIAAASTLGAGHSVRIQTTRKAEVLVPAGTFTQGLSDDDALAATQQCQLAYFGSERPTVITQQGTPTDFCQEFYKELSHMQQRRVTLDAYLIDRDEVTVTDYRACIDAGACDLEPLIAGDDRLVRADWPIVNITWDESRRYCEWRGGRLPTEAEWERAARGDGSSTELGELLHDADNVWPWGAPERPRDFNHGQPRALALRELERNPISLPIRFFGDPDPSDGASVLAPPGTYPWGESPYGTRDQAGNVAEWTADAYVRNDTMGYDDLPDLNPRRDGGTGENRVVRGGSWRQPSFTARSNLRDPFNLIYEPSERYSHIGFRCARTVR